ncbi:hypothetical protein [Flavobacterium piscisymbiosum]|uniref:Uncharacterized protein n=1 Tax=Flavobacterium piscisymbiosum TaxID=2893753 RepID=A0ABS8MD00_9FLAO|nr:hypothetical protein [Flavobacterium sp. F-30]MCC9063392.1 hypothetical protein [Flavobacterium sp. F-30]
MRLSDDFKFWSTLIIGLIGALAWLPIILENLKEQKIEGKIISSYNNTNKDKTQIFFLYKLSIVATNKDFLLKDIDLKIKFKSSSEIISTSRNNRIVVFNIDGNFKKLNVPDNTFLNNLSILKKDSPEVGYLFFSVDYCKDEPIDYVEFKFISFDNKKEKSIRFTNEEIKNEKLLFDDSIWTDFDMNTN